MKKLVIWSIFACFLACWLYPVAAFTAFAQDGQEELGQSVKDLISQLDLDALQAYINSLSTFSDGDIVSKLLEYIAGKGLDYEGFLKGLLLLFLDGVKTMIPSFACIAGIALICGVLNTIKSSVISPSTSHAIFIVSYLLTLVPVLTILIECYACVRESVGQMKTQMEILYPLLITMMAASGGSVSAAIYRPAVSFLSGTIVTVVYEVVFPITLTMIALGIAGNLSPDLKIKKFSASFKSMNKWIIGICVSLFTTFFSVQGLTSASYDGISRKAAKYAIGNGIPIVGGFLSGGFDLAVAGSVLIKNSLGVLGIFMMASVVAKPLLLLVCTNVFLRFTAAVCEPIGDQRISDFLAETADHINYFTAGLLLVAFLYLVSIVLLVCSAEVVF